MVEMLFPPPPPPLLFSDNKLLCSLPLTTFGEIASLINFLLEPFVNLASEYTSFIHDMHCVS